MTDELDALAPDLETATLSDGTVVQFHELKARQFFKLLKILTHGPAMQLMAAQGQGSIFQGTGEEILGRLVGFVAISIPDSFDETIQFLYDMVEPASLGHTKQSRVEDNAKLDHLAELLSNPEIDDLIDLIEIIVKRESSDLVALGKKVGKMLQVAEKTGQLPDSSQTSQEQSTSEASRAPATSSVPNMDGQTNTSLTSV